MEKRKAFTLAEVLITLGIIGVVAAMTLPTLLNSTQQATFRTQLKKSITVLSQAASVNLAINDYDTATAVKGTAEGSLYALYKDRTNVVSTNKTHVGKWLSSTQLNNGTAKTPGDNDYIFNYNDGSSFYFANTAEGCSSTVEDPLSVINDKAKGAVPSDTKGMCIGYIDVNGPKAPNTLVQCDGSNNKNTRKECRVTNAYDVFPVLIDGSNLYPATSAVESFYNNNKAQ